MWSAECEDAFTTLKEKLTVSPVLAYLSLTEISPWKQMHRSKRWELSYHNKKMMESFTQWLMPVGPSTPLQRDRVGYPGCSVGHLTSPFLPLQILCPCPYQPLSCKSSLGDAEPHKQARLLVDPGVWQRNERCTYHLPSWA